MPGNECDGFESKALSAVRAGDEEMEDCHSVSARIEVCFFFFFSRLFSKKNREATEIVSVSARNFQTLLT